MDHLLDLLNQLLKDPAQARLAFVALISTSIGILGTVVGLIVMNSFDPMRRRIKSIPMEVNRGDSRWPGKLAEWAARHIKPRHGKETTRVKEKLRQAGYRGANAPSLFFGIKIVLAIVLPMIVLLLSPWFPKYSSMQVITAAVGASFSGSILPNFVLNRLLEKRQELLRAGFPDALDMLVVCVEAGLGLNAAIKRVSEEIDVSYETLADELSVVNSELLAGVDNGKALKNLADRTGLDDVRGLVTLLIQSIRYGTSVADTLRVYSEEFRDKRMQRAEEKAAMIGTKMLFPLVLCIFPSFFLVMIGPAVIGVMEAMGK